MNSAESREKNLETVYKYFSHHIRTNTSVIVATLEAINEGLSDQSMTEMIMESGYLLDLFDRGMSVCFNHILGKEESSQPENVELGLLINLFIKNAVTKDGTCCTAITIPKNIKIHCEPYSFKNLTQILLHETALVSRCSFKADFKGNELTIAPDHGYYEFPAVFSIFEEIYAKQEITAIYNKTSIILRFRDENINC